MPRLPHNFRLTEITRLLTPEEIAAFPGDAPVSIAIRRIDGQWYYGDTTVDVAEDGSWFIQTNFVTDVDSLIGVRYIPVL